MAVLPRLQEGLWEAAALEGPQHGGTTGPGGRGWDGVRMVKLKNINQKYIIKYHRVIDPLDPKDSIDIMF